MNTDWIELPDIQAVAMAQDEGWEIEESVDGVLWYAWTGGCWDGDNEYHGRAKPKPKLVTSECWRHKVYGTLHWIDPSIERPDIKCWERVPAWDYKDGEVKL